MDLGLSGKIALVAAASKGLGRAIARRLAQEGCRVAICARQRDPLEQAAREIQREVAGENAEPIILPAVADLANAADCERFVHAAVERWGGVDILVTNSGGPSPGGFEALDEAAWERSVQNTLMNVVRLIRCCVPHMKRRRWGRIVNIASSSAKQPIEGLLLSNTLRPAIVGLAKTLSIELGADNILINTVCPGSHRTQRLDELAAAWAAKNGTTPEQELERMAAACPLKRLGQPEELAAVVAFLCGEPAGYVNGQSIVVDGGAYRGLA